LLTFSAEYRTALITCRKHRIDLNLLYDLDPQGFMSKLDRFVDQVHEVDHLNLFISSLR
jgi:elongator complex protein 1